ncbi:hypothetical protein BLOT_012132 [Blomia tropicalis]|nr:hypothetical protein BLOT_012132 [Blomia tropicalis]
MDNKNKSHVFCLPNSGTEITFIYVADIDLFVITDAKGFGQNWVRVSFCRNIYECKLLMGNDRDDVSSIARHFSENIIKQKLENTSDELASIKEINLTFSISLRNKDPATIRLIKEEFDKNLLA